MSLILKYDLGNPHRLPVGYTPLAYIESTGTLYIDTGWIPNNNSTIVSEFEPLIGASTSSYYPLSCIKTSNNKIIFEVFIKRDNTRFVYSANGTENGTNGNFSDKLYVVLTTNKTIRNGTVLIDSTQPTIETSYNCILLGYNDAGTVDSRHLSCKLYKFRGFDGNTLTLDLIPAKRNSDGVIGMFDIVSQTFKTNDGTGEFIAGPEVVVLPYEYLQVEYLESNGTQRINTEYAYDSTNNTYHVLCLFLMISAYSSYQGVYGAYTAEANSCFRLLRNNSNTKLIINSNSKAGGGGTSLDVSSIFDLLESDHTYDTCTIKNKTNNTTYTATISHSNVGTNTTSTFFVFDQAAGNTPSAERIYYFKLYTGTILVRNMIPCYRRSDLKPGMYDTVNNVFYTNSGSGEFILGPVVEESSRQLEYNNAGSNYIGKPINIHHSVSNPSTTQINEGSGDFSGGATIRTTIPALNNSYSISWWANGVYGDTMMWSINYLNPLYYLCLNTGDGYQNPWYRPGTTTQIAAPSNNVWHHFVITGDGSSNKLYVDGVHYGTSKTYKSCSGTALGLNYYLGIAAYQWNGKMYDFRIYNNVLTADEVLQIYKGGV